MTQTDPTFKVAISRFALDKKIPPGDPFWHDFNGSFDQREITAYDLAGAIWNGHPLTPARCSAPYAEHDYPWTRGSVMAPGFPANA